MATYFLELNAARFEVPEGETVLGRAEGCNLVFHDPRISRRHARLVRHGAELWVEDLDSANGTWRNAQRVEGRRRLRDGDVLSLGSTVLRVLEVELRAPPPPRGAGLGLELAEHRTPPPGFLRVASPEEELAVTSTDQFGKQPPPASLGVLEVLLATVDHRVDAAQTAAMAARSAEHLLTQVERREVKLVAADRERLAAVARAIAGLRPEHEAWAEGVLERLRASEE